MEAAACRRRRRSSWMSICRTPWTTPPDFRLSRRRGRRELGASGCGTCGASQASLGGQETDCSPREPWRSSGPLPANGAGGTVASDGAGGWVVHDKAPNTFFFRGSYIYIYIARMWNWKIKSAKNKCFFWRFSIATIRPNFKKIRQTCMHGSSR
jgi:hypothetical protein